MHVADANLKGESIPAVSTSAISKVMKKHLTAYLVFAKEEQPNDTAFSVPSLDKEQTEF